MGTWSKVEDWELLDDIDILNIFTSGKKPDGELYVANELFYKDGYGAFSIHHLNLPEFILCHLSSFGQCFFNGDVIILQRDKSIVWVFNHDGFYKVLYF